MCCWWLSTTTMQNFSSVSVKWTESKRFLNWLFRKDEAISWLFSECFIQIYPAVYKILCFFAFCYIKARTCIIYLCGHPLNHLSPPSSRTQVELAEAVLWTTGGCLAGLSAVGGLQLFPGGLCRPRGAAADPGAAHRHQAVAVWVMGKQNNWTNILGGGGMVWCFMNVKLMKWSGLNVSVLGEEGKWFVLHNSSLLSVTGSKHSCNRK